MRLDPGRIDMANSMRDIFAIEEKDWHRTFINYLTSSHHFFVRDASFAGRSARLDLSAITKEIYQCIQ
jgi:hypothetical protein